MARQTKAERAAYMAAYYQKTKHLQNAGCYLIYKITNKINNRFYIGITKKLLHLRMIQHKFSAKSGRKGRFMAAIRKYGIESFRIEQIDTAAGVENANQKEMYYVATLKPYYNSTLGGDGTAGVSYPKTGKWKKHMSEVRTQLWKNPDSRFGMSLGRARAGNPVPKSLKSGAIHKGRDRYWTAEKIAQRAKKGIQSKSLLYRVMCPGGQVVMVENLAAFCRSRGLDQSALNKTAPERKGLNQHKGFRLMSAGVRKFVSLRKVADYLKVSLSSSRNLRTRNPVMFLETVEKMKDEKIIPEGLPAFPA